MNLSFRIFTNSYVKPIIIFAAFSYFLLLFYIFFLARRRRGPTLPWSKRHLNLIPFKNKYAYFISQIDIERPQFREFYFDLFGNILLFVPFAFILYFILHIKDNRKIMIISFVTSISIEITQFVLSIGVADVDDIILNTTGAAVGLFILKKLIKINAAPQSRLFRSGIAK